MPRCSSKSDMAEGRGNRKWRKEREKDTPFPTDSRFVKDVSCAKFLSGPEGKMEFWHF